MHKQLNLARNRLHKSFGKQIKDSWSKIKSVFKDTDAQKLQKDTLRNSKIISDIDKNLEEVLSKIEKSVKIRQEKLETQLSTLGTSKYHYILDYEGHRKLPALQKECRDLDQKLATSLMDIGQSIYLGEQSKPISPTLSSPQFMSTDKSQLTSTAKESTALQDVTLQSQSTNEAETSKTISAQDDSETLNHKAENIANIINNTQQNLMPKNKNIQGETLDVESDSWDDDNNEKQATSKKDQSSYHLQKEGNNTLPLSNVDHELAIKAGAGLQNNIPGQLLQTQTVNTLPNKNKKRNLTR